MVLNLVNYIACPLFHSIDDLASTVYHIPTFTFHAINDITSFVLNPSNDITALTLHSINDIASLVFDAFNDIATLTLHSIDYVTAFILDLVNNITDCGSVIEFITFIYLSVIRVFTYISFGCRIINCFVFLGITCVISERHCATDVLQAFFLPFSLVSTFIICSLSHILN